MGDEITGGKLYILKSQKVWWKPWTWFLDDTYVKLCEVTDIKICFAPDAVQEDENV